jgi:hypothetical protein
MLSFSKHYIHLKIINQNFANMNMPNQTKSATFSTSRFLDLLKDMQFSLLNCLFFYKYAKTFKDSTLRQTGQVLPG